MKKDGVSDLKSLKRKKPLPAVGKKLGFVLNLNILLLVFLSVTAVYLAFVTLSGYLFNDSFENYTYLWAFLVHLIIGFIFIVPFCVFSIIHIRNTIRRKNFKAVKSGFILITFWLITIISGLILTRIEGVFVVRNPYIRTGAYWFHVLSPITAALYFMIHRKSGRPLKVRRGVLWLSFSMLMICTLGAIHFFESFTEENTRPDDNRNLFFPSLAGTASGKHISAELLMMDSYCRECHSDIHKSWQHSMHKFSSFNNPAYRFTVNETMEVLRKRDGNAKGVRFCAGCHDPVPLFSGRLDNPDFDDQKDITAQAGITCTVCHRIKKIKSVIGNSDFIIEEPVHYPFTFSENKMLKWINHQLVKAKPEFHKKTFAAPVQKKTEFCGTCHKVHIPEEVNRYKWLRAQNHYDSFLMSGVSGHGVASFYYPEKAKENCTSCHMQLVESEDFGADFFDDSGRLKVHDHMFPSANTAVPHLAGLPPEVEKAHKKFLKSRVRVDIFGMKEGGTITGALTAPLRPALPVLNPGETYLLETVVRTLDIGHAFTQGTSDSNQIWLELTLVAGGKTVGRSGGMDVGGRVDPWAHFLNAYVLDREGRRIDRRNGQDIFVPLYDHQIPPGAADVIHYKFRVPSGLKDAVRITARLKYRKFDTTYMRYIFGADYNNRLPVTVLAEDSLVLPVSGGNDGIFPDSRDIEEWERWNDYGIGLLRKGTKGSRKGELRQAESAFKKVESMNKSLGALNLGRVYFKEGRLDDAVAALRKAAESEKPAYPWTITWFTALVNKQNGYFDDAIEGFSRLVKTDFAEAKRRGFDFSLDVRLHNEFGQTLFERARLERGKSRKKSRELFLREALKRFKAALEIDPENVTAHYNLSLIYAQLELVEKADVHRALHSRYRIDDNARDRAFSIHRADNPPADHAAEAIVIYDLNRPGSASFPTEGEAAR